MTEQPATREQNAAGKYLTFSLGKEEYGLPILKVKEIVGLMPINTIPEAPAHVKGVINLRDKVIPVTDLRRRFNLEEVEPTPRTCIIIVEVESGSMKRCWEEKQCGKTECPAYENADRRCWIISGTHCRNEIQGTFHEKIHACRKCAFYQEMHDVKATYVSGIIVDSVSEVANIKDIEPPDQFGDHVKTSYISGIAKMEGKVKILLDINQVIGAN